MISRVALCSTLLAAAVPVRAQCPDGSTPPCRSSVRAAAPAPAANTVAVLYFDNLSRDSANAYLADGFTEELISRLTQVEALRVKSRTAVRQLRDREQNPAEIGRTLGVAQLISGSVMPSRGRLRINVELTRAATGNTVWARSYDRPSEDLFNVQAEIAESIAVNVGGRLAPAERKRIEQKETGDARAFDHLMRARFEIRRNTPQANMRAVRELEAALRYDPTMVSALVLMSVAYSNMSNIYFSPDFGISRDSLAKLGRQVLSRAVRLDSTSSQVLQARVSTMERPGKAIEWLAQAVAQEPRNASLRNTYATQLRLFGYDSAAVEEFKKVVALEPDRAISLSSLGQTLLNMGRAGEAAIWFDSALAFNPEAPFYYREAGLARLRLGDTTAAKAAAERAGRSGSTEMQRGLLAMVDVVHGDTVSARARLVGIESAIAGIECVASHMCLEIAFTLASVGERERALAIVERMKPRDVWVAYWLGRKEFDPIRNDPRFQAVHREALDARERLIRNP
jgi:TolB-like protein/Tfp pilus assembly protein PilF